MSILLKRVNGHRVLVLGGGGFLGEKAQGQLIQVATNLLLSLNHFLASQPYSAGVGQRMGRQKDQARETPKGLGQQREAQLKGEGG